MRLADVFDYVKWRGDLSFSQSGFGAVDGAILSVLTFIDFDALGGGEDISIGEASAEYCPGEEYDSVDFGLIIHAYKINKLFCECGRSKRFSKIVATDYVEHTDEKECVQFAAVCFHLGKDRMVVAFRGTDDSVVGWKEDCCLSYMEEIPAQRMAIEYLERIAEKYPEKRFYVVGHSKGGNMGFYSCLKCSAAVSRRIIHAYSYDGPGLSSALISCDRYRLMKNRLELYLPDSSFIGTMFRRVEHFAVVKSPVAGLFQHDPFNWEVSGAEFVTQAELSPTGKMNAERFRERMEQINPKDRCEVVEAVFGAIASSGIKTLSELREGGFGKALAMLRKYGSYDKEKRELVRSLLFRRV